MSATMARQGGRVQLEQSNMCLALNMAKMAIEGFSHSTIEETKYLIKKPYAEVREERIRGVEFPGHNTVEAAIQRHPAMLRQNQTSGCIPCPNGTAKNTQTRWRCKGTGAPPPARRREGIKSRLHICQAPHPPHPPQPVTLPELNLLKL